jgi:hypothetical protein
MSNTIFRMKPNFHILNSQKSKMMQHICNNIDVIFYISAFATIGGGIMHLLMLGSALKPVNFPMQLLPYTDGLFIISGIMQIFWCIPMIKRLGINWYYIGLVGTIGLSLLLLMTRIPNGITNLPLEDKNPMALLTEVFQFLFIAVTTIIIINERQSNKISKKIKKYLGNSNELPNLKNKSNNDEWFKERYNIKNQVIGEYRFNKNHIKNKNTDLDNAKSLCIEGIKLSKSGRDNEAIKYFEKALRINSQYVDALYNMGVSLNKLGRKTEAIYVYVKAKHIQSPNYISI